MKYLGVMLVLVGACQDRGVQPKKVVAADSADQVYDSMTFSITRDGIRSSRVQSESAWVYQGRQVADLKNMTVTSFDSSGAVISTITAARGIYGMREQSLDARGNVIAHSSGGRVLKTEHLMFTCTANNAHTPCITSDTAFTSTSPQGSISGANFVADPGFKNVNIVKGKAAMKGKGLLMPGQNPAGPR